MSETVTSSPVVLQDLLFPYIREFTRHWNAFLEKEDEMIAEIYAISHDGMLGVVFLPVEREPASPLIQVVNASPVEIRQRFPQAAWSHQIAGTSFFEILDEAVIVIKPNATLFWTEELGADDADDSIRKHWIETMPEDWKQMLSLTQ